MCLIEAQRAAELQLSRERQATKLELEKAKQYTKFEVEKAKQFTGLETERLRQQAESAKESEKQLREQLTTAKQVAEQGSQQLQGEILELDIEQALRAAFPFNPTDGGGDGDLQGIAGKEIITLPGLEGDSDGSYAATPSNAVPPKNISIRGRDEDEY